MNRFRRLKPAHLFRAGPPFGPPSEKGGPAESVAKPQVGGLAPRIRGIWTTWPTFFLKNLNLVLAGLVVPFKRTTGSKSFQEKGGPAGPPPTPPALRCGVVAERWYPECGRVWRAECPRCAEQGPKRKARHLAFADLRLHRHGTALEEVAP